MYFLMQGVQNQTGYFMTSWNRPWGIGHVPTVLTKIWLWKRTMVSYSVICRPTTWILDLDLYTSELAVSFHCFFSIST